MSWDHGWFYKRQDTHTHVGSSEPGAKHQNCRLSVVGGAGRGWNQGSLEILKMMDLEKVDKAGKGYYLD